jgi:hypothetical protein
MFSIRVAKKQDGSTLTEKGKGNRNNNNNNTIADFRGLNADERGLFICRANSC